MDKLAISVIILNYNGKHWIRRCLESLVRQTILTDIEIIVADNASSDGSDSLARALLKLLDGRGRLLQNGANLGYCEGNNRGAAAASGKYLLFLNNDTWLEPNCLEQILHRTEATGADAASPRVLNYEDDSFQTHGAEGFDFFGYLTSQQIPLPTGEIFAPPGCALFIKRAVFEKLGGFDPQFFMYADETDLSWRLGLAGYKVVTVAEAKVHHRGSVAANPCGGSKVVEYRTTEMVRFHATRNGLLVILKNAQHVLLLLALSQLLWISLEALAVFVLTRNWPLIRRAYLRALSDVWRLRHYIREHRRIIGYQRKHGDFWMLRFMKLWPGRWPEIRRMLRHGPPKVIASS